MNARDTSLAAYRSLDLTEGQRKVMRYMHGLPAGADRTRAEITRDTGIPLQSICGRCAELVPLGFLEELKARACRVTGNSSHPLRVPKAASASAQGANPHEKPAAAGLPPAGAVVGADDSAGNSREIAAAAAAPDERTIFDSDGKPFYVAVGYGPGWPPDQDHLHRRRAA